MNLITPKNAIEVVLERKTKAASFKPYETTTQKCLFWFAVAMLTAGAALGILFYFWREQVVALIALILLLLSSLFAAFYQIVLAIPEFMKLKNVEREISNPLVTEFNTDIDLVSELARDYLPHHLAYARDSYSLMAEQLRSRVALLVGAIDKVGLIPLAATVYLSGAKAFKDGIVRFGNVEWILVAIIFLYLLAIRMNATVQWMERMSLLYKQACEMKCNG